MTDEQLRKAMNTAFHLGQTYWSQVDSEYSSHWKKGDVTRENFNKLVVDTIELLHTTENK
jgi:hypothetical protein